MTSTSHSNSGAAPSAASYFSGTRAFEDGLFGLYGGDVSSTSTRGILTLVLYVYVYQVKKGFMD